MFREVLRDLLHLLMFADFVCAFVVAILGVRTTFFRAGEQWDRRSSLFSLRRPLLSQFSKEYYASWRRSQWLGAAFVVFVVAWAFLSWLDMLIFRPAA